MILIGESINIMLRLPVRRFLKETPRIQRLPGRKKPPSDFLWSISACQKNGEEHMEWAVGTFRKRPDGGSRSTP
jgi:hypothetical protein